MEQLYVKKAITEFGLPEGNLGAKMPVKLAHGIRITRLVNQNFYMMLPTLDDSSLGCYDGVVAYNRQNLAANVAKLWPESCMIFVRPSQLDP